MEKMSDTMTSTVMERTKDAWPGWALYPTSRTCSASRARLALRFCFFLRFSRASWIRRRVTKFSTHSYITVRISSRIVAITTGIAIFQLRAA